MEFDLNGTDAFDSLAISETGQIAVALDKSLMIFEHDGFNRVEIELKEFYFEKQSDDISFYNIESNAIYTKSIGFSPSISEFGPYVCCLFGNQLFIFTQMGKWSLKVIINEFLAAYLEIDLMSVMNSEEISSLIITSFAWSGSFQLNSIESHALLAFSTNKCIHIASMSDMNMQHVLEVEIENVRSLQWCKGSIVSGYTFLAVGSLIGQFIIYRIDIPSFKSTIVFQLQVDACIDLIQWHSISTASHIVSFTFSSYLYSYKLVSNQNNNKISKVFHKPIPTTKSSTILFSTSQSIAVGSSKFLKEYLYTEKPINQFDYATVFDKMKEKLLSILNRASTSTVEQQDINMKVECYLYGCRMIGPSLFCHYIMRDPSIQQILQPSSRRSYMCSISLPIDDLTPFDTIMTNASLPFVDLNAFSQEMQLLTSATKEDMEDFVSLEQLLVSNLLPDTTDVNSKLFIKKQDVDLFYNLKETIHQFLHFKRKCVYLSQNIVFDDPDIELTRQKALLNCKSIIQTRFIRLLGIWLTLYHKDLLAMTLDDVDILFIQKIIQLNPQIQQQQFGEFMNMNKLIECCPATGVEIPLNNLEKAIVDETNYWDRCQLSLQIIGMDYFYCKQCNSYQIYTEQSGFIKNIVSCCIGCLYCSAPMKFVLKNNALET